MYIMCMYFSDNFNAKSCNGSFSIVIGPNETGLRVDVILVFHILRNNECVITQWHNIYSDVCEAL